MLTLHANHPDTLWDQLLPDGVRTLPEDLARLDQVLCDPQILAPFRARFQALAAELDTDPGCCRNLRARCCYVVRNDLGTVREDRLDYVEVSNTSGTCGRVGVRSVVSPHVLPKVADGGSR
jgi:hypothetical protein